MKFRKILRNTPAPGYKTCNFIKKETLALVLYCEFCEISKNTFYYRTPLVATYVLQITFDPIFLEKHSMKMFLSFENIKSNLAEKELSILSYLSADAFSTIIWKNSLFKNWWEQRVLSSSVCCFYLQKNVRGKFHYIWAQTYGFIRSRTFPFTWTWFNLYTRSIPSKPDIFPLKIDTWQF